MRVPANVLMGGVMTACRPISRHGRLAEHGEMKSWAGWWAPMSLNPASCKVLLLGMGGRVV